MNKFTRFFMVATVLVGLMYMMLPERGKDGVPAEQPDPVAKQETPAQKEEASSPEPVAIEETSQETESEEEAVQEPEEQEEETSPAPTEYPAGKTVDEAWKTLVLLWKYNPEGIEHGIYTEVSKFILKGSENEDYFGNNPRIYIDKPYKVIQRGDYAVVDFLEPEYEEHLPFLFCKTEEGWKFDLVHQRKLVRFGEQSYCGVEKYITPYTAVLRKFPAYTGIDVPVGEDYFYKVSEDSALLKEIQELEKHYKSGDMTFEEAIVLAQLYSKVSLDANAVSILEKTAKALPDNPDVYKYMAISYVNCNYRYREAEKAIKKYLELVPDSDFGQNFLAYLYLNDGKYGEAEKEFEKTLELQPENCYAGTKLAQVYGRAWSKLSDENEEKALYEKKYQDMFKKAGSSCKGRDYERFIWLVQWKHSQFGIVDRRKTFEDSD